ncbi:MAG: hypothetical protein WBV94_20415 [Blastocatellia bacterium]
MLQAIEAEIDERGNATGVLAVLRANRLPEEARSSTEEIEA